MARREVLDNPVRLDERAPDILICAAARPPKLARAAAPIGGSERGYQELFVLLAIPAMAGQACGEAVYLCSAEIGAGVRFCRVELRQRDFKRTPT